MLFTEVQSRRVRDDGQSDTLKVPTGYIGKKNHYEDN